MSITAAELLKAYEGFETSFANVEEIKRYRESKLAESALQAAFICSHCPGAQSFYEVGTGNGRLLVALAQQGITGATGIDVSQSRIAFAQRWASELSFTNIRFTAADGLQFLPPQPVDCSLCITGALGYFDVLTPNGGLQLLKNFAAATRKGGWLVLELYTHPRDLGLMRAQNSTELRVWRELAPSDPWRYYLSHLVFSPETKILVHHKTFIRRSDSFIDQKKEAIRIYTEEEIRKDLQIVGFTNIQVFGNWKGEQYQPEIDETPIIVAQKT